MHLLHSQTINVIHCLLLWPIRNFKYLFLTLLLGLFTFSNFRRITLNDPSNILSSLGDDNDPTPTIYIAAPHSNQFLDPMVILFQLYLKGIKRLNPSLSFFPKPIMANISFSITGLASIAKLLDAISVSRTTDTLIPGTEPISIQRYTDKTMEICLTDDQKNKFQNENFIGIIYDNNRIYFNPKFKPITSRVSLQEEDILEEDTSDSSQVEEKFTIEHYKFFKANSNEKFFEKSCKTLYNHGSILIFPEGGSHDGEDFQPFQRGYLEIVRKFFLENHSIRKVHLITIILDYNCPYSYPTDITITIGDKILINADSFVSEVDKKQQVMELSEFATKVTESFKKHSPFNKGQKKHHLLDRIIYTDDPIDFSPGNGENDKKNTHPKTASSMSKMIMDQKTHINSQTVKKAAETVNMPPLGKVKFIGRVLFLLTSPILIVTHFLKTKLTMIAIKKSLESQYKPMKVCGCDSFASTRMLRFMCYAPVYFGAFSLFLTIIFSIYPPYSIWNFSKRFMAIFILSLLMAIVRHLIIPKYFIE